MAKKQQQRPIQLDTPEDVEFEIDRRVKAQMELFPSSDETEIREGVRQEVEDLYESRQQAGREVEKYEAPREPTPYVEDFDSALRYFEDGITAIDDYVKLDDKDALVGRPFVIMQFWPSIGEVADEETGEVRETTYVTMKIVTKEPIYNPDGEPGTKFTVTDGSTGVCRQLLDLADRTNKFGGVVARHGLRKSEYPNPRNKQIMSSTFYLT